MISVGDRDINAGVGVPDGPSSRVRCPRCHRDTTLFEIVEIEGWRALNDRGESQVGAAAQMEAEMATARPTGDVGCGECQWKGTRDDLEHEGADGAWRAPRVIHTHQRVLELPERPADCVYCPDGNGRRDGKGCMACNLAARAACVATDEDTTGESTAGPMCPQCVENPAENT